MKSPKKKNLTLSTARIIQRLGIFFPGAFGKKSDFLHNPDGQRILERIKTIPTEPLHLTNFNQLLHLVHEAGVSEGFFKYYFLSVPDHLRDIHPLSRLIEFETGVAIGAMVTTNRDVAAVLLSRIFSNNMEYTFEQNGDGYFRLRERETNSVVRLQTNWKLLREAFWNYYHGAP